jgi:hypothetical protein
MALGFWEFLLMLVALLAIVVSAGSARRSGRAREEVFVTLENRDWTLLHDNAVACAHGVCRGDEYALRLRQKEPPIRWTYKGCWNDEHYNGLARPLEWTGGRISGGDNDVREGCARHAVMTGRDIFAIQDGNACMTGATTRDDYTRDGASDRCAAMTGGPWLNSVWVRQSDGEDGRGPTSKAPAPKDDAADNAAHGERERARSAAGKSCYGSRDADCNTCDDVVNAYKARGWAYDKSKFEQCRF